MLEAEAIIWTLKLLLIDGHGARLELLWPISPITARLLLLAVGGGVRIISILIFHVIRLVVIIVDWLWVPRWTHLATRLIRLDEHFLGLVRSLDLVGLGVNRAKLCRLPYLASRVARLTG